MPTKLGDMTIYNLKEISSKLGVTAHTLRRYIKQGIIAGRKTGGKYMVTEESLRKYFEETAPGSVSLSGKDTGRK